MTSSLLVLALLPLPDALQAAQHLKGAPDDVQVATLSRGEPTMIKVEGGRVKRLFGAEGDYHATANQDAGAVFVRPTTDKQAISVYVADDDGATYRLLLSVADGPADTIILHPRKRPPDSKAFNDTARNQGIKGIVRALADDAHPDLKTTNEVVPLWHESLFVRLRTIENGAWNGEQYRLTNTSASPMHIDERELYRPGVVAISVDRPSLAPGESALVYLVMEAR